MSYVPGYDHDFFISYAKVNNDPVPGSDRGWIDTLVEILTTGSGLAGKLGRRDAFTYWMDNHQLRGNHEVNNHIPEQVRQSALLVVILSPSYLASKFCQLELETFLKSVGGAVERMFVVYTDPLDDRLAMPEALRGLRKYEFWQLGKNNKVERLGWPLPVPTDREDRPYYRMVDDLCKDIADKLGELKKESEQAKTEAPRRENGHARATNGQKPAVLLAETTDDLVRKRDEARRYLEQAGIDVLPAGTYYGLPAAAYENAVLNDLSHCAAFVQLLGPELGRRLNDVPDGFGWLQYSLAKRAQRPILQWRSPELKDLLTVEDSRQRRLLEGADAMSFEDFKQAIVRSVASVPSKPIRPSFFFINCDAVDTEEADEIGQQLGGEVDWERPPYEDKPEPGILQNKIDTNLVDCDGLFIVQGKVKPDWVRDQLQQYRKARWRRATAPRVLAVVQTGETPHELKGVGVAGLKIIGIDDIPDVVKSALAS